MIVALGADHAGFAMKQDLVAFVRDLGHEAHDLGTSSEESVDYPDFAASVAQAVAEGKANMGVLVCGTGLGMAIVANKIRGVRAVSCSDSYSVRMARAHNDANVLTLGSRVIGSGIAQEIVRQFLDTAFEGGRHSRRLEKFPA